jgi:hypothetical protein
MNDRCLTSVGILIDEGLRTTIVEIIIQIEMDSREMIASDECLGQACALSVNSTRLVDLPRVHSDKSFCINSLHVCFLLLIRFYLFVVSHCIFIFNKRKQTDICLSPLFVQNVVDIDGFLLIQIV